MRWFIWLGALALGLIPAASMAQAAPADAAHVAAARLHRGVNVLGYDPIWQDPTKARFQQKHFTIIRDGGFDFVRFVLQAFDHMDAQNRLDPQWLATLDRLVAQATKAGLGVILDEHDFDVCSDDPDTCEPRLIAFWQQIGERYRNAPKTVLFEFLNEPHGKLDGARWNALIARLIPVVRKTNPKRTLVIGPTQWNNLSKLSELELPAADRNIIATFHYYDPFRFTHQGAAWTGDTKDLHGIPFTAEDEGRIASDFDKVAAWSKAQRRPVLLGEFGAYDESGTPIEDRARYARTVRSAAEARGMPWAYWQFDSNFIVYDIDHDRWVEPIRDALTGKGAKAEAPVKTAPEVAALPIHIGGRVIPAADGSVSFGWPGSYIEGRFKGPAIRVKLDAPTDFLRVLIDGHEAAVLKRPGNVDRTFNALGKGEHVIRLEKLTESQSGGSRFIGFYPAGGSKALPAPPARARQIEFIGDSYTVGYGNTSPVTACTADVVHDTTDTQQAFGPLVARHFDADYRINAYSGFGVVRNYNGGAPDLSLPAIYDRLKPDDAGHKQGARGDWQPQAIVINLGTNDFSTPVHAGEHWPDLAALRSDYRAHYVSFVKTVAARQPQARIILMASSLFFDQVQQIAATLKAGGGPAVSVLKFDGLAYSACNSHPSLADEALLATSLEARIGELEIWQ